MDAFLNNHNHLGKRLTRSPKICFYDMGLVSYLTGIRTKQLFEDRPMYGALFENHVVSEVMKKLVYTRTDAAMIFFRGKATELKSTWSSIGGRVGNILK